MASTYRVPHLLVHMSLVDLGFECSTDSAGADGNLAEAAEQLGKMVEQPIQSQPKVHEQSGHPVHWATWCKPHTFLMEAE